MADERVAWFRGTVADWNRGAREVDWDRVHPECEVHSALIRGVVHGADGVRTWFNQIDQQFDAWQLNVESERRLGPDRFLLTATVRLRGRGSGLELDQEIAWLLEFERERLRLLKTYTSVDQALAEAGTRAISLQPMSDQRMRDRFVRLCGIASPTGDERAVADAVLADLRALGVEVSEDGAAGPARAGAGNLVARIPGGSERWLMLCSHLDTVPHDGRIEVVEENGVFRSGGETILGADNKAAVAVLIELAARHAGSPPPVGLELVFTVAEEDGLRGAKELDLGSLSADVGVVIDHASPIGEVLIAAPTYKKLVATFRGHEAHAGIEPEAGHSAIAAAAAAIAGMELGRLDEETTANVGLIEGGTASNVVAGSCRIEGEARGIDGERAAATVGAMVDACTWAAGEHGCDVDVEVTEVFRGYRADEDDRPVRLAREALRRAGHEPRLLATGGGSDANALRAAGFDCILLANGTEANHTPQERVRREALGEMLAVCEQLLAVAAAEAHAEAA